MSFRTNIIIFLCIQFFILSHFPTVKRELNRVNAILQHHIFTIFLSNDDTDLSRLLFLTPRSDGFNNQLITVSESILCARMLNRTLVLPLFYANVRYDTERMGPFPFRDYFDLDRIRAFLPSVTVADLLQSPSPPCPDIFYTASAHADTSPKAFSPLLNHYRQSLGVKLHYVSSIEQHAHERCIDDSFCSPINFQTPDRLGRYSDYARAGQGYDIRKSDTLREIKTALLPSATVREMADAITAYIGQPFNAMHVRRGDYIGKCQQLTELCNTFGHDSFVQSKEAIVARMRSFDDWKLPVYISTTHPVETRGMLEGSGFNVTFRSDVQIPARLMWAKDRVDVMAFASQVVVSRARQFVGNRYSSFSSEINNMRFLLNKTETRLFF